MTVPARLCWIVRAPYDMPTSPSPKTIPRRVPSCDVTRLPLSPKDAYVLSLIDNVHSVAEIVAIVGCDEQDLCALLTRLADMGAICFPDSGTLHALSPPPTSPAVRSYQDSSIRPSSCSAWQAKPAPGRSLSPRFETPEGPLLQPHPTPAPVELRRKVIELASRLDAISHYELLGIPESAEVPAIKRAYHKAAKECRQCREGESESDDDLSRIASLVYERLSAAHDTLVCDEKRARYDAELRTRQNRFPLTEHGPPSSRYPPQTGPHQPAKNSSSQLRQPKHVTLTAPAVSEQKTPPPGRSGSPTPSAQTADWQRLVKEGMTAEQREAWADAARAYELAARLMIRNADIQYRAANALFRANGDRRSALAYAKRAAALVPSNAQYRGLLGRLFLRLGMRAAALDELQAAASLSPNDSVVLSLLKNLRER